MSATPPVSGVAIPGARAQPASALSSSLLAHEGELMEAITGPANASRVSQSPFAAALSKGPTTARKTLLVLNASSWIGQAHLGAVSQTSLDLVDALRSPVADSSFSPWTQGGSEEGSVNPGGFYTGAATQAVAGDARAPSLSQLAQSPSASFLSAVGMKRAGSSSMWYPGGENDLSAGGKLRVVAAYKGSKAPLELPKGVDKVVNVDFDVPGSIDAAFDGESVDYVYIIPSYGANRVQQTNEIIQACLRHRKVRYVVLLSLLAPKISGFTGKPATSNEGEFQVQREFRDLERTVAKSGIPHTFVRVGIFHHQLFEIARRSAEWVVANNPADADVISLGLPLKTGSVAPVDVRDVALVTSHLFTTFPQNNYINRNVDVTGPQLLSGTALVGAMSRGLGRPMRYTNVSTTDFAQFLTRVGLAGSVRDVEAICGLWATAGKGEWAFTGVDVSEFAAAAADGRKRRGIPLSQHFQERKDEILSIFAGLDAAQPASPASPARATGASLVRSNSLLGNAGPVSTHARRPSIPSPLLGDLSNKSSPPPTSQDLPTPSAPTTTWWTPGNVENKIGIQMSPAEWLKRYGPSGLPTTPKKFAVHVPGGDKKDEFYHGFVADNADASLKTVAEEAVANK